MNVFGMVIVAATCTWALYDLYSDIDRLKREVKNLRAELIRFENDFLAKSIYKQIGIDNR